MSVIQEFKTFAMRGNVIDMAVGIIIGAAFGKIVASLVADVIMPPIGLLIGGVDFTSVMITLKDPVTDPVSGGLIKAAVVIKVGNFLQTFVDFIIIVSAIFMMIKGINRLSRIKEEPAAPATPPPATLDQELLMEIRDLLKKQGSGR